MSCSSQNSRAARRPRGGAAVGAVLALSLLAGSGGAPAHAEDARGTAVTASASSSSVALPFDLPAPSTLRASEKKVFAHYVSWAPLSLDDKEAEVDYYTRNYLSPTGEGGKYAAVGGKQRDRPMPRPVRGVSNWRLLDMEQEVREAIAAGLDGFVISMVQLGSSGGQWAANTRLLLQAASNVDPGFSIVLRPNMISFKDKDAATVAADIAGLAAYDSAHRLADGRLVVSPYKAEEWSVDKWKQFLSIMASTHEAPVALWPMFHNERLWSATFDPISYGMSHWGDRNPAWNDPIPTHKDSRLGRVAAVHALGQKWMQPVSVGDARPREGIFDEAENTTNLRKTWQIAIDSKSEAVHLPTWNDHAEGSQIQLTRKTGGAFLDLTSYYLTWFKTGSAPAIVRDRVYLTHRTQPAAATPTYAQTTLMSNRGGSPTRDTVEALTFLTAPATVTVSVGAKAYRCSADAGIDTCTVPLGTGRVSVKVERSGATVTGTTSPHVVTATPYVQDLDYVAVSSGRLPGSGTNGTTPTSTTLVPKTVLVPATADASARADAPSTNSGASTSLSSRGSTAVTSYLRFAVPANPPGTVLSKAALRLRTSTADSAGSVDAHHVSLAGNTWSESTLTWQNRPSSTGGAIGTLTAGASVDTSYDLPLQVGPVATLAGTQTTVALTGTGTDELLVSSRNHATYTRRPQLVLTYLPVTAAAVDVTPPATPAAPTVTSGQAGLVLTWSASSDAGSGVAGYEVHGSAATGFTPATSTLVGTTTVAAGTAGTTLTVPARTGTWYYRVVAKDAAGNRSIPSAQTQVVVADTAAPSRPSEVSVAVTGSSVSLAWTAAEDDVAVTGYEVHRSSSAAQTPSSTTLVGQSAGSRWTQSGVPAGTWYYRLVAKDAAGNRSAASTDVAATVLAPAVLSLTPTADTYVNEAAPSRNFGTTSTLSTRGEPGSTAHLRFSVPAAPAGRTLTSAVLRFRTTGDSFAGSSDLQSVRLAGDAWTETGLTWDNRPATSTTALGSVVAKAAGTQYSVALSPAAVRTLEGRSATLAVTSSGADSVWFWSSQHASAGYRPLLVLTWS